MKVHFTAGKKAFVRPAIETGRLNREEDAVKEALSMWEERERRRLEILASVSKAQASLARGEGRLITSHDQAMQFANEVKQRVSDHRKTCSFERCADRYRRGMAGNGSIQRPCRPLIVHWHTVGGWGGAGGVIAAVP
jgi:Arc/MetJ-type ribon-helix-helix transcriptional regulator